MTNSSEFGDELKATLIAYFKRSRLCLAVKDENAPADGKDLSKHNIGFLSITTGNETFSSMKWVLKTPTVGKFA